MSILRRPIALIALAAVCILGTVCWLSSSPQAATNIELSKPVAVVKVERGDLVRDITFSAELRPYEEADLHAKVAGYLKTINVDIGDQVKAGQTLATLDVPELRDDLARDDAALHDATLDFDRLKEVVRQRPGLLAQQDIDRAQATFEMAKANRERAATMLSYATITAPFTGIITRRYVDPGALIQAGTNSNSQSMPVVHIAENTVLRLIFPAPEAVVPQIKVGTPVEVAIEATGTKFLGKIARMAGKLDTSTRTMDTEVDIDNRDLRMTPGMYTSARVILEKKTGALELPIQAISTDQKPTVWRVNDKGEIEEIPVVLGMKTDARVEIISGLNGGDEVVFGNRNATGIGKKVQPKLVSGL